MSQYKLSATCQIPRLADLYEIFLGFKMEGVFVEVGAYDGEYVSNTSGLADIGWRGLYIEPVTQYAEKCAARHACNPRIEVIHCAVGESEQAIEINIGGPLSTIHAHMVEKFNGLSWAQGFHKGETEAVMQYPLDTILRSHHIPTSFDLLSIDVEGYEWNVLGAFPIQYWKPRIVIIELHDTNPDYKEEWTNNNLVSEFMRCNRYEIIYKDFTNTVYKHHSLVQLLS